MIGRSAIGAICDAPWTLIDAGVAEGRTLTSWPSLEEFAEGVHEGQREKSNAG